MPIDPNLLQTGGALQGAVAASLLRTREAEGELASGTRVGIYRVVRELGRGGMAVVYLAERDDGEYRQQVALKWMKAAQSDASAAALFRRERQSLADLRHPHIARLLDGGRTDDGRPWFAMEYIDGQPLDRHCVAHRLSLAQRLALFRQVCDAVAFAHARGVIHRDIKPSNVLVDVDGRAKLLDFGIAQLMGKEDDLTLHAHTPGFASPEQLRGETPIVASDIYQLGRVLASLLSADARESEALTASEATRVNTWLDAATPIASHAALPQQLPRDLAAILAKATALEPSDRHSTAEALADDVRAFLEHRPVSARPHSAIYVARRFVRRHPIAVTLAVLALAQLTASSIGLALQARQTRIARDEAVLRADALEKVASFQASQLADVDTREMGVHLRASMLDAVPEAQREQLETALASVNFTDLSIKALEANIFSNALQAIERDFADQRAVKARLLQTVATTTRELGLLEFSAAPQRQALDLRRAELGATDPDTLHSRDEFGELLLQQKALTQAEAEFRDALPLATAALGEFHDTTLDLTTGLALSLQGQGRMEDAEALFRTALDRRRRFFGETHDASVSALNNLGNLLQEMGRYDEAEPLLKQAIALRRRTHAEGHPGTSIAMVNLGGMYLRKQAYGDAEKVLREAVDLLRRHQGDDHHLTLTAANTLGVALQMQDKLEDAEGWSRMAMEGRRRTLGESNKDTLSAINAYAVLLTRRGRADEAEDLQRGVLDRARRVLGPDDYLLGIYRSGLGRTLAALGRRAEAEKEFLEARDVFARGVGASFLYAQRNLDALAQLHEAWEVAEPGTGHAAQAARWRRELETTRQSGRQ
jgi:tetratricopeptide (TPR) repeat protein/predicted Ser/Thr protein kinase